MRAVAEGVTEVERTVVSCAAAAASAAAAAAAAAAVEVRTEKSQKSEVRTRPYLVLRTYSMWGRKKKELAAQSEEPADPLQQLLDGGEARAAQAQQPQLRGE